MASIFGVFSRGIRLSSRQLPDKDDGTYGLNDDFMHFDGNTRSLIKLCRCAPARALAEDGRLKLGFRDENSEFKLVLHHLCTCGDSFLKA